jgi:hypothetical protein
MATYGSNSLAVRFQRNVDAPVPENKAQEMPPGGPQYGSFMPGGKETPLPGRRRAGPKDLPWRSWLQSKRPGIRRKRKSRLASLMS